MLSPSDPSTAPMHAAAIESRSAGDGNYYPPEIIRPEWRRPGLERGARSICRGRLEGSGGGSKGFSFSVN
ncbi:hypothetical protein EYF80_019866 [Liparis tanakae]|uniref:Uncharacterized protein n=1 Tax=Liparis tanakae TaxID=230148 RepID=A0A4Z2HYE0_9TELE|nr:hypothetical protein EYF80_019866 [Liparis tanakae]